MWVICAPRPSNFDARSTIVCSAAILQNEKTGFAGTVSPLNNWYVSIPQDVKRIPLFFCTLATLFAIKIVPGTQHNFANLLCCYHNHKVFQSYQSPFVMFQRLVEYVNLYDLSDTTFLCSIQHLSKKWHGQLYIY